MIITDLTQQKRKGRINVYLDGEFVCGLDELTLMQNRLKVGDEISREKLEEIQLESEKQTATDKAMAYAMKGAHSEKRMRIYLAQKGYMDTVIDEVIEKLKYYDYVNDERLATDYVGYYKQTRGINRLKQDLRAMGIEDEIIRLALQEVDGQDAACRKAGEKYLASHKNATKVKLCNHLAAKGFEYDLIRSVANSLFDGMEE